MTTQYSSYATSLQGQGFHINFDLLMFARGWRCIIYHCSKWNSKWIVLYTL